MTALVFLTTMYVKLIIAVETLATEATFWMASKPALVYRTRVVIAEPLVLSKLLLCEQFMFMREYLLMSGTKIAKNINFRALFF